MNRRPTCLRLLRVLGRLQLALVVAIGAFELSNRSLAQLHLGIVPFLLLTAYVALLWWSGRDAIRLGRDPAGGSSRRRALQGALTLALAVPWAVQIAAGEPGLPALVLLPLLGQGLCLAQLPRLGDEAANEGRDASPAAGPSPTPAPPARPPGLERALVGASGCIALAGAAAAYPVSWTDFLASNFPEVFVERWNAGDLDGLWRLQCCPKPGGVPAELLVRNGWTELPLVHDHTLERSPAGVPRRLLLDLQEGEVVVELFAIGSMHVSWLDFVERP